MLQHDLHHYHEENAQGIVIPKPQLQAFLRSRLYHLGFTQPYEYLAQIIFARKSGQDIAAFYDTWDNNADHEILTNEKKHNDMVQARDELLMLFSHFLNCCPLTSFLIHCDILQIDELPDGLMVIYTIDKDQIDSTTVYGNKPYGYVPGTIMGF